KWGALVHEAVMRSAMIRHTVPTFSPTPGACGATPSPLRGAPTPSPRWGEGRVRGTSTVSTAPPGPVPVSDPRSTPRSAAAPPPPAVRRRGHLLAFDEREHVGLLDLAAGRLHAREVDAVLRGDAAGEWGGFDAFGCGLLTLPPLTLPSPHRGEGRRSRGG